MATTKLPCNQPNAPARELEGHPDVVLCPFEAP
jgi:hypothetical protein